MIKDMYTVMNRINEIKKRFGLLQVQNVNNKINKNNSSINNPSFSKIQNEVLQMQKGETTLSDKHINEINKIVDHYAKENKISPNLLKAVIKVESNYNVKAISNKGAKGLMQLMPSVLKDYKVNNPFSPDENIRAGSGLLKSLLKEYNFDYKKALAAYNAGRKQVNNAQGVPNFKETKDFVQKVINSYMQNK